MQASDLFREQRIKLSKDGEEEPELSPTQSERDWAILSKQLLSPVSYAEQNIQMEAHLEALRKELEEKSVIRREKVEPKTYAGERQTVKPKVLKGACARLSEVCGIIRGLQEEERRRGAIISHFWGREYIRRKERELTVHIQDKTFLALSTIQKGSKQAYIEGRLFMCGEEFRGYITEREVAAFSVYSCEAQALLDACEGEEVLASLEEAVHSCRDRMSNTEIEGEYATRTGRAKIQRVWAQPSGQSERVVFLICAMKHGMPFEEALRLLEERAAAGK
ncbi:uncharacterized protein NEMAJ01_0813 [Nematocida major]|uniref:uncharacterized protein n=1 Tax=Nematocida major TaxID=1912982 RepID=UPI002008752C|nr:uncharacterized protein NEMAJ01_0813 [Nematocida major]KAH9385917.1 hypothetical protein NEMAJ01_0813 [Nematocida major]